MFTQSWHKFWQSYPLKIRGPHRIRTKCDRMCWPSVSRMDICIWLFCILGTLGLPFLASIWKIKRLNISRFWQVSRKLNGSIFRYFSNDLKHNLSLYFTFTFVFIIYKRGQTFVSIFFQRTFKYLDFSCEFWT